MAQIEHETETDTETDIETETETEEENAPEAEETQQQTPPDPAKEALEGQKVRDKVSPEDKSAKAFAEMRVKATSYERALQIKNNLNNMPCFRLLIFNSNNRKYSYGYSKNINM